MASAYRLQGLLVDAETGMRGYALTGNPIFTQPYDQAIAEFPNQIDRLSTLTKESGGQGRLAELEKLALPVLAYHRNSIEMIRAGHREEVIASSTRQVGKNLMDAFRGGMERFVIDQRNVEVERERSVLRAHRKVTMALAGGCVLNIALALYLAVFFTRSISARVRVVRTNMERLERGEQLQDPVKGHDDIAGLDQRFHQMATAVKRAEEDLNRFFTISLEMLCVAGFDGFFKRLNPAWETVLGYSREELSSRPFIDFVHPEDRQATIAEAARLAEGSATIRFENRYRCVDGSYRWLLWNAAALPETQTIYAAAADITERKQFESTLQDRNVALESANSELESFSYSVSHDLRSPLRAVDGYTRILQEEYGQAIDDEGRRLLDVVRSEARRMGMLIDDLLAFSRLGRQSLSWAEVDLSQIASEIVAEKCRRYPNREIVFQDGHVPIAVADRSAVRQVLFNLIANAVKYAKPEAAVHIEFGGGRLGDHNIYWIRDRGIGFDMRYAEKIFGVFQRLHSDGGIEGSGVGLAIVQRIIQRHGGRVWAESEPGQGATFFFTLPAGGEAIPRGNA